MQKNSGSRKVKITKGKTNWNFAYNDHPSDKLKIRLLLDEKIKGDRIIGLEAKLEPGNVHQLHFHDSEFVLVYTLEGKCSVTVGKKTKTILPRTMIFIPPKIPHKFWNKSLKKWEAIAFAIGSKKRIKNIWLD